MSVVKKEHSAVHFRKGTRTLPSVTHMYRPELHRQVTERVPVSRVGHELSRLCQSGLGEAVDAGSMAQAKMELTELLDKMLLSLRRNRQGLDMSEPVLLHSFPHWHVIPETRAVCLLPVTFQKAKVIQKSIGHVLIKVPPLPKDGGEDSSASASTQHVVDVRSKDGVHVSPRKLHAACARLVHSSLLKHGVTKDRVEVNVSACDSSISVLLDCGWRAELVPCVDVCVAGHSEYYVARRFSTESYVKGDLTWRPCSSVKDQNLLRSISCTDGGLRLQALFIACRVLSRDWRLQHFTCYHLQTVLLHDMDFHVDHSPRWQRSTLESCFTSLLRTLLYFVDRENLPHFELNQLNLWADVTQRQLSLARHALTRLLTNENALVSLVRRASWDSCMSVDLGLLSLM